MTISMNIELLIPDLRCAKPSTLQCHISNCRTAGACVGFLDCVAVGLAASVVALTVGSGVLVGT